jgi:hypothetical protein
MKGLLQKIGCGLAALAMVAGIGLALAPTGAYAALSDDTNADKIAGGLDVNGYQGNGQRSTLSGSIRTVINVMLWIVGVASLIMLVFGGIRYATSAGNDKQVKGAKDTIMYAVIGLVVAIFGFAIVNFVVNNVGSNS